MGENIVAPHQGTEAFDNGENPDHKDSSTEEETNTIVDRERCEVFSVGIASYIHESWFAQMDSGELMLQLKSNERAKSYVNLEIMSQFNLEEVAQSELNDSQVVEIILADPEVLHNIVWQLGLVLCGTQLRGFIDGQEIRRITESLGPHSFQFGLKNNGRLVVSESEQLGLLNAFYSESKSCPRNIVIQSGMCALKSICESVSTHARQRFEFKFPVSWAACLETSQSISTFESVRVLLLELLENPLDPNVTTDDKQISSTGVVFQGA